MRIKFSLLISTTIIFSLLLPTVIPRSYRLQNPEQNLLLINSKTICKDSIKSTSNEIEAIKHINSIKNTLIIIGDKLISYGYKDLKHPMKVKFNIQNETDSAQSFNSSILDFYISEKFDLNIELLGFVTRNFSTNRKFITATNILTVLSKRTE